jgi:hypothetical protein
MSKVIAGPEENGTFAQRQNERFTTRGDAQGEAVENAHGLRPNGRGADDQTTNSDLDKFRHLFGRRRRGDSGARRLRVPD